MEVSDVDTPIYGSALEVGDTPRRCPSLYSSSVQSYSSGGSTLRCVPPPNSTVHSSPSPPSLEGNGANYDDSIRRTEEKIDVLLLEAQSIGDSIQTLLSKGKITRAESLYVIDQTAYLSELNKIIKQ